MQVVGDAACQGLILSLNAKRIGGRRVRVTRDERSEPNAAAKRVQIDTACGGRGCPSGGQPATPLIVPVVPEVTAKFENWLDPEVQLLGGVTGIADRNMGAAGQIVAQAGAANARGIANINIRLNIGVFFREL